MNSSGLKFSLIILLFGLLGMGCKREDDSDINLVIKELPILYLGYNLKTDETVIIRDQETFEKVFSKELVTHTPELQNIDFSKFDVLAGQSSTPSGFATLRHKFFKLENNSYQYQLYVSSEIVGVPINFCYGIIVNKLSLEANIQFEVNKN